MHRYLLISTLLLICQPVFADTGERTAKEIVRDAIDHWRGTSSQGVMTMTIHRPDWERSMSMESWTRGEKKSLVRVTEPRKDRGNGTLMVDNNMWTFSPKINRVIKVPSSMMSQSWMGSDFSNKDISRADDIVDLYRHALLDESADGEFSVYEIEAIPHEDAAVVWGREVLLVRSDNVLVEHRFYDQDGVLVKRLRTLEIGDKGGRAIAIRQRMEKVGDEEEWTEIVVDSVQFDVALSDNVFTLSNLRNPRD